MMRKTHTEITTIAAIYLSSKNAAQAYVKPIGVIAVIIKNNLATLLSMKKLLVLNSSKQANSNMTTLTYYSI